MLAHHREALAAADLLIRDQDEALRLWEVRYGALDAEYFARRQADSLRLNAEREVAFRLRTRLDNRRVGTVATGALGFLLGVLTKFF